MSSSRIGVIVVFSAAMAVFEAPVATALWRLWELGEIDLTASPLSSPLLTAEVLREAASIVMIGSVAFMAGRNALHRLGYASLVFGLWDLLYYVFLRLITGWPRSVFSWDVLFLIPRPWVGPVLAPALVAAALALGGAVVIAREEVRPLAPGPVSWLAAIGGGAIVIVSFLSVEVPESRAAAAAGFSWALFLAGYGLALAGFAIALLRTRPVR